MKIKILLSSVVLLSSGLCSGAGPNPEGSNEELFDNNWNIVWARCVSAELAEKNWYVVYTFDVIETMRGFQKQPFQIHGNIINWQRAEDELLSFNGHRDEGFWSNMYVGRCWTVDDAGDFSISFNVGWKYLIFMDKPYNVRGFEIVSHESDKWYLYVKQKIIEQKDQEEKIRYRSGMRQVSELAYDVNKQSPQVDRNKLLHRGLIYVAENPKITNLDIEAFMHDPQIQNQCMITGEGGRFHNSTVTTNAPPQGAAGSGGSESSNP